MSEPHWVLSESQLIELLERASNGEDPGLLITETYANSDTEPVEGTD